MSYACLNLGGLVQPRLELEEVQVPPRAPHPVVDRLIARPATGATQPLGLAGHLKIDPVLGQALRPTFCTGQGACRPNAAVNKSSTSNPAIA